MPRRNANAGPPPRGPSAQSMQGLQSRLGVPSDALRTVPEVHDESRPTSGAFAFAAADPKLAAHKRNGGTTPMAADDEPQTRPRAGRPLIYVPAPDLDWRAEHQVKADRDRSMRAYGLNPRAQGTNPLARRPR